MAKFKASFQPSFPIWEYNPDGLAHYNEKALRKEYSRMRAAAEKRLRAFERAGMTDREAYLYNVDRYPVLKAIPKGDKGAKELGYLLTDMARFMTAKLGTVGGQRENDRRLINTFEDKWGIKGLNMSNIKSFVDFLEFAKGQKGFKYEVSQVAQQWEAREKAKIDPDIVEENWEFYRANYSDFGEFWKAVKDSGLKWRDKEIVKFYKEAKQAGITGDALRGRIAKAIESGGETFSAASMIKVVKVLS